jgi:SPP1 family phage portal protein
MFDLLFPMDVDYAKIIREGANNKIDDEKFIIREIERFKRVRRQEMIDGERYYENDHDINKRKRLIIGEKGEMIEVKNLPNNKLIDNQYSKMVDQKKNYLLGNPIVFKSDNEQYNKALKRIFNRRFHRLLKSVGEDSFNGGIAYIYPYYNDSGELTFKRFKSYECIPGWSDNEHTELEYLIRVYEVIAYEGQKEVKKEKVELYLTEGIFYFELDKDKLIPDEVPFKSYFNVTGSDGQEVGYNWTKVPIVPFKYNAKEIPLIRKVKSLQDALNLIVSNFQNNMEEDPRNTIMVLVNYDGENLGEFRQNLATYGAVKVKTVDGAAGDLKTLQIEVNADNYKAIINLLKKAIIDNAKGYDAKDERLGNNPNEMNIQSIYSDIDLDANDMETEYQASFEELLWFVDMHLYNTGVGDFENEEVEVIFNRDTMISESNVIDNIGKSVGILSKETLVANHPWVDSPQAELDRLDQEQQDDLASYGQAFVDRGDLDEQE